MKSSIYTIFLLVLMSCSSSEETDTTTASFGEPTADPVQIEQNFMEWWIYYNEETVLSTDFKALDSSSAPITKDAFLESLTSGAYIPIRLENENSTSYFKLHPLSENANEDISKTIENLSIEIYKRYKMEGTRLPDFDFKDLDGEVFNNENTKGKFVVLKCWFIGCTACVAEFPEVNKLVSRYENREDIEFISIAYDSEEDLKRFLKKRPLDYSTVSVSHAFLNEKLNVQAYPTHFLIDQKGIIKKVVSDHKELAIALKQEL